MEVHHHSHTERKKWTHYVWEFFMLFLAVFCGFLAEYQLEHKIEKDREKQLIRSLVNDLAADTARLNEIIDARDKRATILDSLSVLLNSSDASRVTSTIYYYGVFVPRILPYRFIPNDGTMQQLKNAGGLRLVHKRKVADSIMRYDISARNVLQMGDQEQITAFEYRAIAHKIFDAQIFDAMMDANNIPSPLQGNPGLAPYNKSDLFEINYKLFNVKALNRGSRREVKQILQQAKNLIVFLNKEYNF